MSRLGLDELILLEEKVRETLDENLTGILSRLNRTDQLEQFLELCGMDQSKDEEHYYDVQPTGKIVVLGEYSAKPENLIGVAKSLGISKERLVLHLDYQDGKRFDARTLRYKPEYAVVLVGQMPHSGKSKGDFSSVITAMERSEGFPPVVRMGSSGLKITKSDFGKKLHELIERGWITA